MDAGYQTIMVRLIYKSADEPIATIYDIGKFLNENHRKTLLEHLTDRFKITDNKGYLDFEPIGPGVSKWYTSYDGTKAFNEIIIALGIMGWEIKSTWCKPSISDHAHSCNVYLQRR